MMALNMLLNIHDFLLQTCLKCENVKLVHFISKLRASGKVDVAIKLFEIIDFKIIQNTSAVIHQ